MRIFIITILAIAFSVGVPAQTSILIAGGAAPDGFALLGRAGGHFGVEAAFTRAARETERSLFYVRREEIETVEAGASVRWRASRVATYGSAGVSRESAVGSFEFLYPTPSGQFGGTDRRLAPYLAGTATVRLFGKLHAIGRYVWRGNAAFVERQSMSAGLGWEW